MAETKNISEVDLVVFGGTPAGIAAAVRGARGGLDVVLIYTGRRAPIFDEIVDYYRQTYGANSQQLKDYVDTRLTFEPHIAELVLNKLIDNTQNLTVLKPYFPTAIKRDGNRINEVQIQSRGGEVTRHDIKAEPYIDATYEGDLAALAGVAYSAGRESRQSNQLRLSLAYKTPRGSRRNT